jgi:hypothetical protein
MDGGPLRLKIDVGLDPGADAVELHKATSPVDG